MWVLCAVLVLKRPHPGGIVCLLGRYLKAQALKQWLAAGKTDREIATQLGCSHRTVQKHLQRLYVKLGVETRTAAVMRALNVRPF